MTVEHEFTHPPFAEAPLGAQEQELGGSQLDAAGLGLDQARLRTDHRSSPSSTEGAASASLASRCCGFLAG